MSTPDLHDPDVILNSAMDQFMTQQCGRFDPGAPVVDQWAQAVSAALEPDTDLLARGQVDAVKTWLDQAADSEDQRWRRIALTLVCRHLPTMYPQDRAAVRADPAKLIKLAETYYRFNDNAT